MTGSLWKGKACFSPPSFGRLGLVAVVPRDLRDLVVERQAPHDIGADALGRRRPLQGDDAEADLVETFHRPLRDDDGGLDPRRDLEVEDILRPQAVVSQDLPVPRGVLPQISTADAGKQHQRHHRQQIPHGTHLFALY